MPNTTFPEETADWSQLATSVDVNIADLAHLEPLRVRLVVVRDGAMSTKVRQEANKAQLQQSTRDLDAYRKEGRDLSTRLRNGLRMQYGLKGEKLTEFGMKPRRKPQRKAKSGPVAQPAPVANTPVDTK